MANPRPAFLTYASTPCVAGGTRLLLPSPGVRDQLVDVALLRILHFCSSQLPELAIYRSDRAQRG